MDIKDRAVNELTNAIIDCHASRKEIGKVLAPYFPLSSGMPGSPEFMDTAEIDKALKQFLGMKT